jgi:hypothetical protein
MNRLTQLEAANCRVLAQVAGSGAHLRKSADAQRPAGEMHQMHLSRGPEAARILGIADDARRPRVRRRDSGVGLLVGRCRISRGYRGTAQRAKHWSANG